MESLSLTIELLPKFYLGHPTPKPEIIDNLTIIYILPAKKSFTFGNSPFLKGWFC